MLAADEVELGRVAAGDRVSGDVGRAGVLRLAHARAVQLFARALCRVFLGVQGSRIRRRAANADRFGGQAYAPCVRLHRSAACRARDVFEAAAPAACCVPMRAARGKPPSMETRRRHARHLRRRHGGVVCAERRHHRRVQLPGRRSQDVLLTTPDFRSRTRGRRSTTSVRCAAAKISCSGDVLVNTHSGTVLRHNLWYFLVGRNAGLLPYFFPGMLALALFLFSKQKQLWQWLALATIAGGRRDARLRLAVHLERRRRTGRQPVLSAVLRAVSRPDSGDGRRRRGDRRVCRRRAVHRAARAEPVLRLARARRRTPNRARCACFRPS